MRTTTGPIPDLLPSRRARVVAAIAIATGVVVFVFGDHLWRSPRPTDFGIVWFAARSLFHGVNPYPLVGPGLSFDWDWPLYYPATSFIVAMPFALLPQTAAAIAFVWVSSALLAYAVTARGWQRLFLFPSAAFLIAARTAQWSILFSAIICQPELGWFLAAKPNSGLAIFASTASKKLVRSALAGGIALTLISLILLPSWPLDWLMVLKRATHMVVPIMRPGGFLILLALIRWRRPEARLIVALACVPQTGVWYEALPLLTVADTRRECQFLSLISSIGFILCGRFVALLNEAQINRDVSTFMVGFAYLPAMLVVLRRQNAGGLPAVLSPLEKWLRLTP